MYVPVPTISTLMRMLDEHGDVISPRGQATTELIGVACHWPLGIYPTRVKLPKKLAAVEGVSLVAGLFDIDLIKAVAPNVNIKLFEQSSKYSLSISRQLPRVVNLLHREPATRRAILYFGKSADVGSDRTTCLTSLQFLIRDGKLHSVLNMRSWDLAWGLPIDVIAVTILSLTIARFLNLAPGMLHTHAGSLHVYDSSAARAVSDTPGLGHISLSPLIVDVGSRWRTWRDVQAYAAEKLPEAWQWVEYS